MLVQDRGPLTDDTEKLVDAPDGGEQHQLDDRGTDDPVNHLRCYWDTR